MEQPAGGGRLSDPEKELPLLGEELAVELANSLYGTRERVDFLESPPAVRSWFSRAPAATGLTLPREVTADLVHDLVGVRDAVRALLEHAAATGQAAGPDLAGAVATLDAAARRASTRVALGGADGNGGSGWTLVHAGRPDDVLVAAVASRCILFVGSADVEQVRACDRPGCSMLFVQRHRARRFCHESCAHSVRQARYYRTRVARGR